MEILQALYDSEINAGIEWQWDGGVDWKIVQGFGNETIIADGNEKNVEKALMALKAAAIEEYPDSVFAKNARGAEPKKDTFEKAARPLIKYMAENHHPHTVAHVDSIRAELFESQITIKVEDYLVD
jgi:hypothetical protein